jgi:predicted nicotinamide N-methyase
MSKDYYAKRLSAERLRKVYEVASPRARRYLEEEIRFVLDRITPDARVLELGCGAALPGIAAERAGAGLVVCTDCHPLALDLALYNG